MPRAALLAGSFVLTVVGLASSCSDEVSFEDDAGTTTTSGTGGMGGSQSGGCNDCESGQVCVDGEACADSCPGGRAECEVLGLSPYPECCAQDEQCCPAQPGYGECQPAGEPCPLLCPDNTTTCSIDQFCALDAVTGTYSCAAECETDVECGDSVCCPLGSTCDGGACVFADLTIDNDYASETFEVSVEGFDKDSCMMVEGCIDAPGDRTLLRFSLRTPNIGDGDLRLGDPFDNPLFVFSPCHGHFHFESYARYRLLDTDMNEVASGHKQAFCLLDYEPWDNTAGDATYDCSFQGISRGWADTYEYYLDCQWVDITEVPPGDYLLEIVLNGDQILAETDYDNNTALIPVTLPLD
jgi:hypothetical protein